MGVGQPSVGAFGKGRCRSPRARWFSVAASFTGASRSKGARWATGKEFLATHGGSSSKTCGVLGWSCDDAAWLLGWHPHCSKGPPAWGFEFFNCLTHMVM
jgi:hypothetical protein